MSDYAIAAAYLQKRAPFNPEIGIVCGSGLSGLSKSFEESVTIPYSEIPGFPQATVAGHKDELVFGMLGNKKCVCLRGRFHFYEGNQMATVVMPIRVMRLIGAKLLIVTNAAGGLNPLFRVGDVMVIMDHFALPIMAGLHPLVGPNESRLGDRFLPVSNAYDPKLQRMVLSSAKEIGMIDRIRPDGTYCFVSGPTYESKAEANFLRSIGGDSVGMSTIPEVIAAKHCGMKIIGLSLITNAVVSGGENETPASHEEVLNAVLESGANMERLVKHFVLSSELEHYLSEIYSPIISIEDMCGTIDSADNKLVQSNKISLFQPIVVVGMAAMVLSGLVYLRNRV